MNRKYQITLTTSKIKSLHDVTKNVLRKKQRRLPMNYLHC